MTPDSLPHHLSRLLGPDTGRLVLGFSGGLDSSVLLHALCRAGLAGRVLAVHVQHGLHPQAETWCEHCAGVARSLGVAFVVERLTLAPGGNLEARARDARRAALLRHVDPADTLLLAHHRQDQVETLLLRLLRGAGARGLSAMAAEQHWQGRRLCRPLLAWDRSTLAQLARDWGLAWISDPANASLQFDRNYLRHRVWPVLDERWPQASERLHTSAAVLAEQAGLLDELANEDYRHCDGSADGCSLSLTGWLALSPARRRNLLHGWLRSRQIRPPTAATLARVEQELASAAADRVPRVDWSEGAFCRYRERLWLLRPAALRPLSGEQVWAAPFQDLHWQGLRLSRQTQGALRWRHLPETLVVRPARGGERLLWHGLHRQVSELWRVAGVPPWQRRRLPLFYAADELVAVAGIGVADPWRASPDDAGLSLAVEDSAL